MKNEESKEEGDSQQMMDAKLEEDGGQVNPDTYTETVQIKCYINMGYAIFLIISNGSILYGESRGSNVYA